jgi:alpha/beta superfamily hydrolase
VAATPLWFGPTDRPLFGWIHHPSDGRARAGVAVCPPVALEYSSAHYTMRAVAERLEAAGLCALRFDYDGTGDSAGRSDDPERVAAWIRSIGSAVAALEDTGVESVSLVGLRLGALLAARAAAELGNIDQLVLWDPCPSGRSFLHEQRVLSAVSLGITPIDGSVVGPGVVYAADTAGDLRSIELVALEGPVARRALVLTRADEAPAALSPAFAGSLDRGTATGLSDLLDDGHGPRLVPAAAIETIAAWLSEGAARDSRALTLPEPRPAATVSVRVTMRDGASEQAVEERPIRIGPAGLFGIRTDPVGGAPRRKPLAIFLPVGARHHVGPTRLWVDLAREWAAAGLPSVRADLSGLGDSPLRSADQRALVSRAPEAFDDVEDIVRALAPEDPSNVILIGLSASGYQVIESALSLAPKAVVAVNPSLWFVPPERTAGQPIDPRRQVVLLQNPTLPSFRGSRLHARVLRRFPGLRLWLRTLPTRHPRLHEARRLLLHGGWRLRMGVRRVRRPTQWLADLVERGVDVCLICGEHDARPIRADYSKRRMQRLERSGRLRFEILPELDHSLQIESQTRALATLLTEHVVARFGEPPAPNVPGESTGESRTPDRREIRSSIAAVVEPA